MANPTTYFGWVMPTSADLVTDLPADFNVFGQGVDTSMQYLLGGTTGQVLSKTSATNMAFSWINNDQGDITGVTAGTGISVTSPTGPVPTVAIDTTVTVDKTTAQTLTNKTLTSPALTTPTISTATTNGDLLYGTGSGALQRLGIGSASQVLTVAAGIPSWATPAGGSGALIFITKADFSAVSSFSLAASTFSATYRNYKIIVVIQSVSTTATYTIRMRASGTDNTTSNYSNGVLGLCNNTQSISLANNNQSSWKMGGNDAAAQGQHFSFDIYNPQATQKTFFSGTMVTGDVSLGGFGGALNGGFFNATTSFDSLSYLPSTGTITGHYEVYGYSTV